MGTSVDAHPATRSPQAGSRADWDLELGDLGLECPSKKRTEEEEANSSLALEDEYQERVFVELQHFLRAAIHAQGNGVKAPPPGTVGPVHPCIQPALGLSVGVCQRVGRTHPCHWHWNWGGHAFRG